MNLQANELKGEKRAREYMYSWYEEQLFLKPQLVAGTAGEKRNIW
jgi:hypothetical protein